MQKIWLMTALVAALGVAGCDTLDSINPFTSSGDGLAPDPNDDSPITRSTGSLPADSSGAKYSEEELRGQ